MSAPWRLDLKSVRLWLPVLLIVALAKGAALFVGYSIDDYSFFNGPASDPTTMLAQGRFGQATVSYAFDRLGLVPPHAGIFFALLGMAASTVVGVAVVRFWNLRSASWHTLAAASFIAIHPFTTEMFTFRTANGSTSFAFLLLGCAIVARPRTPGTIAASAGLLAFSLSIYQVVLNYVVIAVVLGVTVGLTRCLLATTRAGARSDCVRRLLTLDRQIKTPNAGLTLSLAIAVGAYSLGGALAARVFHVTTTTRAALLEPADWRARAGAVAQVLHDRILGPSPLVPDLTKRVLILIALAALVGPVLQMRRGRRLLPLAVVAANSVLFAAALVWSVGLAMLLKDFWPAPRVMSQIGVFWAGALAVATLCYGRRLRAGLGVLAALAVLSFVGSDNRILQDQLRLNARDLARANRELARLEQLPGFDAREVVSLVGAATPDGLPYATSDHDLNMSAFIAPWSKLGILREVSGYDLRLPSDTLFAKARGACDGVERFPGTGSVMMQEGMAIVCLGPSP